MKRREVGQSTQRAAAGTRCCIVCQHCWEEGINHCAVWHGACFGRKAPSPLCREVSTKSCDTHTVSSRSSHSAFWLEAAADSASSGSGVSQPPASFLPILHRESSEPDGTKCATTSPLRSYAEQTQYTSICTGHLCAYPPGITSKKILTP